jgi:hypothetical protein
MLSLMVRRLLILGSIALLLAGCGDDGDTTSAGDGPAVDAAPLVPEVVCVDHRFHVHFAYDNQAATAVVLGSEASRLSGTVAADDPFVPTVFAPGRQSPVFVAYPADAPTDVVWELTGPDGTTRSATPTDDTPRCDDALLAPTTQDPRTPSLEVVSATLDPSSDEVTVEVELTGVPPTSVCNEAFEPEPAEIRLEDPDGNVLAEGTTVTLSEPVFDYQTIGRAAGFDVAAVVIDRCTFDGTTFSSWPVGEFATLLNDPRLCVSVAGDEPTVVDDACSDIAPTGGIRNRG